MYNLYYGEYNEKDYEYLKLSLGNVGDFPTQIENYNIIKPIIDVLAGDELGRITSFNVFGTSQEIIEQKQGEEANAVVAKEMANILQTWSTYGLDIDKNIISRLEQEYEQFKQMGGKSALEILAGDTLAYLIQHTGFKQKISKGFNDFVICDEEIYHVYREGESVNFRVCDPRSIYYNTPFSSSKISDCEYIIEKRYLTLSEIIEEFYSLVGKKEKEWLNDKSDKVYGGNRRYGMDSTVESVFVTESLDQLDMNESLSSRANTYAVFDVSWMDKKEIFLDEEGMIYYDRKETKGKKVKSVYIDEAWKGTRIGTKGDAIYFEVGPCEIQYRNIDHMAKARLPYRGLTYENRNRIVNSLVSLCEKYQILFNEIMYRIKVELATSKGKVTFIDKNMIPEFRKRRRWRCC
jgi:hypothetical protein